MCDGWWPRRNSGRFPATAAVLTHDKNSFKWPIRHLWRVFDADATRDQIQYITTIKKHMTGRGLRMRRWQATESDEKVAGTGVRRWRANTVFLTRTQVPGWMWIITYFVRCRNGPLAWPALSCISFLCLSLSHTTRSPRSLWGWTTRKFRYSIDVCRVCVCAAACHIGGCVNGRRTQAYTQRHRTSVEEFMGFRVTNSIIYYRYKIDIDSSRS